MKIKPYDNLDKLTELGAHAELFCDMTVYDASGMNVLNMMVIYEPEILQADKVILVSEDAGSWKWNHDRRKWERKWC